MAALKQMDCAVKTVEDALDLMMIMQRDHRKAFMEVFGDVWYANFVQNVWEHTAENKALSTHQSETIQKLLRRIRPKLVEFGLTTGTQIDQFLQHPSHRKPPYESSSIPREVRYIGDNKLAFRFKYNDVIISEIKNIRKIDTIVDDLSHYVGDRIWIVQVTRDTLPYIFNIIHKHRFKFDDETLEYLTLAENSKKERSTFVFDPESGKIVANVCDNELIALWLVNVMKAEYL